MKLTDAKLKPYLQQVITEQLQSGKVDPQELCFGIQTAIAMFAERGRFFTKLVLQMGKDGIVVSELEVEKKKPQNWTIDGMWFVLYQLLVDKLPMRVASITIGYGLDPVVTYDSHADNGLPLAFNRPVEPQKVREAVQQQAPAAPPMGHPQPGMPPAGYPHPGMPPVGYPPPWHYGYHQQTYPPQPGQPRWGQYY